MKHTNIGSCSIAIENGMKKIKEYPDKKNGISYAYAMETLNKSPISNEGQ